MADGLNLVQLIGNLGKDPEMRYTANGTAVASFSLAVGRSFGSGEDRREKTEWFNIVVWNKLAEVVAQHLEKGRKVYVQGRLENRSWDGPDGQKRYRTEVVAGEVMFLDRAPGSSAPAQWDYGESSGDLDPDDLPFE